MNLRVVRYEVDDSVAVLTLNRPDRLNAWTTRMEHEYRWALSQADADPEVRAVVVTGAGRGFCAGADFGSLDRIVEAGHYLDEEPEEPIGPRPGVRPAFEHTLSFPLGMTTPVIAAVNGPAAGVGFALMCFADLRFAAAGVKLTTSFARLGLPAEHGLSWVLPRLVGPTRAADLLLSSRVFLAEEALQMGLVNRVDPAGEVLNVAVDYARGLSRLSPSAVGVIKAQLWTDLDGDLESSVRVADAELRRMVTVPDFAEAAAALRERRPPRFATVSAMQRPVK
jgi:enoyl-CoA hydratase/carnithine racemase